MMKTMIVLAALSLFASGLRAQPSSNNNNPAGGQGGLHKGAGRHPHINRAMNLCARAENQLKEAADDYGGHREKAAELIREAKEELKAALEYAKEHRKQGAPSGGASGQPQGSGTLPQ